MGLFFFKSKKRKRLEKEGLATSKTRLKQDQTIGHAINKSKMLSFLILIIVWLFCAMILVLPGRDSFDLYLVANQLAPKTIYAKFDFVYLDKIATKEKQERSKESIPLIFEISTSECENSLKDAEHILKQLSTYTQGQKQDAKKHDLSSLPKVAVSPMMMIAGDNERLKTFKEKLITVLYNGIISKEQQEKYKGKNIEICILDKSKQHFREPVLIKKIPTPEIAVNKFVRLLIQDYSPENRAIMEKALHKMALLFIRPNLKFDSKLTLLEQNLESSSLKNNIYKEVNKGDLILARGSKVTKVILQKYNAYEKEKTRRIVYSNFWEILIYNTIMSFLIVSMIGVYFFNFYPKILQSNQKMGITAIVIIVSVIGIFVAEKVFNTFAGDYNWPLCIKTCLIPLGLTSVLLAVFTGLRIATFSSLLVALVAAIKLDSCFVVVLGLAISCVAGFIVHNAKNYKRYFIKTVLTISIIFMVVELLGQIKFIVHDPNLILWIIALSALNGIVTGAIALAMLFILESIFHESTDMNMLSLCDYNHPLLKRLQLEAPGTYHHSLIVATLAEHAADAIGANPIRARVYALFHDIGKLSKPEYFTENNIHSDKRHVSLKPAISSMVILNHVKEGVNLALKHKLSRKIRNAIEQHHGTDLVYYFYKRALDESDDKTTVTQAEYRYPGPKPRDKEIVLVSLADACEAASRSLSKPNPSKIDSLVWEIMRKRIREGQLDRAEFTFKELALAKESFVKTLTSMMHTRISYSLEEEKDNEGDLFKAARERAKDKPKNIQKDGNESGKSEQS